MYKFFHCDCDFSILLKFSKRHISSFRIDRVSFVSVWHYVLLWVRIELFIDLMPMHLTALSTNAMCVLTQLINMWLNSGAWYMAKINTHTFAYISLFNWTYLIMHAWLLLDARLWQERQTAKEREQTNRLCDHKVPINNTHGVYWNKLATETFVILL